MNLIGYDCLGYIPISAGYPQKENRFIFKGWGSDLKALGWIFLSFYKPIRDKFRDKIKKAHKIITCEPLSLMVEKMGLEPTTS